MILRCSRCPEQLSSSSNSAAVQMPPWFFSRSPSHSIHHRASSPRICGPWRKGPSIYGEATIPRSPKAAAGHKCPVMPGAARPMTIEILHTSSESAITNHAASPLLFHLGAGSWTICTGRPIHAT